jgi:hypothetical protein
VTSVSTLFNNFTLSLIITSYNGTNFTSLFGYGLFNKTYNFLDNSDSKVIIFNENFTYIGFKNFTNPAYMVVIRDTFYITGNTRVYKTDSNFNILTQYSATGTPSYRGIYHNSSNNLIYVVAVKLNLIQIFNSNLTFNDSISTQSFVPYAITSYNNQLYIGTGNGSIIIIENKMIVNSFNACAGNIASINCVLIDQYGEIATTCSSSKVYFYNSNRNYMNKSISTASYPRFITFDSLNRFHIISYFQISIYF